MVLVCDIEDYVGYVLLLVDGLIKFVWVGLLEGFCEGVCFLVDWYLEGVLWVFIFDIVL